MSGGESGHGLVGANADDQPELPMFATVKPATGTLLDLFSYVRAGTGPRSLVVFPGFGDAMFSGRYRPKMSWAFGAYRRRYLDHFTVSDGNAESTTTPPLPSAGRGHPVR